MNFCFWQSDSKKSQAEGFVYRNLGAEEIKDLLNPKRIIFLDFSFNQSLDPVVLVYSIRMLIRLWFNSPIINKRLATEIKSSKLSPLKIFRLMKLSYAIGVIERHDFKFGVTFDDSSPLFHLLSMYFDGKVKLFALQNGNKIYPDVWSNPKSRYGWFGRSSCFLQALISFSSYENKIFNQSKFYAKKIYPLGSLRLAYWKKNNFNILNVRSKNKIYDICVALTADFTYESNRKLASYIKCLSLDKRKNICICLNFPSSMRKEKKFHDIKKYFGTDVKFFFIDEKRAYEISQLSRITVSSFSSVLREVLALGCKIYPLNFEERNTFGPYEEFYRLGLPPNPTFLEFEKKIDYLIRMTQFEYKKKYQNAIKLISANSDWILYKTEVQKLISIS